MNRKVIAIAGLVAIGLAGAAAYQAAAAIVRPDQEATLSVNRMMGLTSTEHGRLEKDFQSFYRKTPQEQQKLREMHEFLQQPGKAKHLKQISENFYQWYAEVGPRHRSELREETNVENKLALVHQIQQEQEEQNQSNGEDPWGRQRGPQRGKLTAADVATVMEIIEDKLREEDQAASEKLDDLGDQTGYNRYFTVMSIALKSFGFGRGPGPNSQQLERLQEFLADERFAEALSSPGQRKRAKNRTEDGRNSPRAFSIWMLADGFRAAYDEEIKKDPPSKKELMEYFVELDDEDQGRFMWYSSEDFMRHLQRKFVHARTDRYPKDPAELFPFGRRTGPRDGGRRGNPDGFSGRLRDRPARDRK